MARNSNKFSLILLAELLIFSVSIVLSGCAKNETDDAQEVASESVMQYESSPESLSVPEQTSQSGQSDQTSQIGQSETALQEQPAQPQDNELPGTSSSDTGQQQPGPDGEFIIPRYSGSPTAEINNGVPFFTAEELQSGREHFISLSDLDPLGRCGVAMMSADKAHMATEQRGEIGHIKPTGWRQAKYDMSVTGMDSPYLYNRCHLLAYSISGILDDERNLITGTRYMNINGMLNPVEERMIQTFERHPDLHILYRVTPYFTGDNLLSDGVLMEARSVEDDGKAIRLCTFAYNVEPGVDIDYSTGYSTGPEFTGTESAPVQALEYDIGNAGNAGVGNETEPYEASAGTAYVLNTNSKKIHLPSCESVQDTAAKNRKETDKTLEELIREGYSPCKRCLGS